MEFFSPWEAEKQGGKGAAESLTDQTNAEEGPWLLPCQRPGGPEAGLGLPTLWESTTCLDRTKPCLLIYPINICVSDPVRVLGLKR